MPAGLQCLDANGNLVVDLTTRMTRLIGQVNQATAGSMSVPAFSQGTPFVMPVIDQNGVMYPQQIPIPTVSGTTLSWPANSNFFYGTY